MYGVNGRDVGHRVGLGVHLGVGMAGVSLLLYKLRGCEVLPKDAVADRL